MVMIKFVFMLISLSFVAALCYYICNDKTISKISKLDKTAVRLGNCIFLRRARFTLRGALFGKNVGPFTSKNLVTFFCSLLSLFTRGCLLFRYFGHAENLLLLLWGPCAAEGA